MPSRIPRDGASGVVGVLNSDCSPDSTWTRTRSVNVPPVSIPSHAFATTHLDLDTASSISITFRVWSIIQSAPYRAERIGKIGTQERMNKLQAIDLRSDNVAPAADQVVRGIEAIGHGAASPYGDDDA